MILAYGGENPSGVLGTLKKKKRKKVKPAGFGRVKPNPVKSKIVNQHKTLIKKARRAGA